jgi:hypothetical protein
MDTDQPVMLDTRDSASCTFEEYCSGILASYGSHFGVGSVTTFTIRNRGEHASVIVQHMTEHGKSRQITLDRQAMSKLMNVWQEWTQE